MLETTDKCQKNDPATYLLEQAMGFTFQAALRAAAETGVADQLKERAKTAEELATELKVDGARLYRLLRMLASKHIFEAAPDGRFSLTPAAEYLCSDHPYSLRAAVLMLTDKTFWSPSGNLTESLRSTSSFKNLYGMSFYEYWADKGNQREGYDFHTGMSSMSAVENRFLSESYPFPENATVVDIAGGMGGLLLAILRRNPTLHGILFDRPDILARHRLGELGDDTRWRIQPGSFFEACPSADFYLLKYITMDWPDEQARNILLNCRKAMHEKSKLLIMEPIIPEGNHWHGGNEIDLLLLASFDGGQTRSEASLRTLLASAGLKLSRVITTGCYVSIAEAVVA
ncbi:methyltransferase [Cronobacter malonaticus]|uniref:methyltransferase n=1 Tax=Cronobacter malonaticus TaxID=413503 RepID=UPI0018F88205|nr:methyltransferase [Cronobacter malonaticus]ELY5855185.1 methyltransferase [Cronobacter malonaticus]WRU16535.1 methyltransferase [Cronobacter malonaticus]